MLPWILHHRPRDARPRRRRHDLRLVREPRGARAQEGARRQRRRGEPGDRVRPRHLRALGGHRGADPARGAQRGLRAARARSGGAGRGPSPWAGFAPVAIGLLLSLAAAAAHAAASWLGLHWMLPAWLQFAAGHAGAVHPRRALLPGRLACAEGGHRQHGPAGGARHQRGLGPVAVALAGARPRAPVLRGVGRGGHAGAAGQVAGGAREAPDHDGDPRAAGAAARDRARDPALRRRGGPAAGRGACAGDQLVVRPGERIPADGVVEQGDTHVDEAMLTGETAAGAPRPRARASPAAASTAKAAS